MESDGICKKPPNPEAEASDASLQENASIENIFKMD
jgi:hypothetical protein